LQSAEILDFEKIRWISSVVCIAAVIGACLVAARSDPLPSLEVSKKTAGEQPSFTFLLPLEKEGPKWSIEEARNQIRFEMHPARPNSPVATAQVLLSLKSSNQGHLIDVGVPVALQFENSSLQISKEIHPRFWIQLASGGSDGLEAAFGGINLEGTAFSTPPWAVEIAPTAFQTIEGIADENPFRLLAASRWWGPDPLIERCESDRAIQRIEVGVPAHEEMLFVSLAQWLVFKEGKWRRVDSLEGTDKEPIARIRSCSLQDLELEGWDGTSYLKLGLKRASLPPFRIRPEELVTQLRVRSAKRVSCLFEKQSLILKEGDWVVKQEHRWKVLRKKGEQEAYLRGDLKGDLFVLDEIDSKRSPKRIKGSYFPSNRLQVCSIECGVEPPKQPHQSGKGSAP
jgi:hypothetical protein